MPKSKSFNGLLSMNLNIKKIKKRMEKSTAFRYLDRKSQGWYSNYGIPTVPFRGYSSQLEMAPKQKLGRKSIYIRYTDYEYKLDYALYNRVTGKVAIEGSVSTQSTFSVFSGKPPVKRKEIQKMVLTGLKNQVVAQLCSETKFIEQIYTAPSGSPAANLVNEGVNLAKQNRWKLAATKWENAVSKDSKNSVAHHNLGVYYEFNGSPTKALPHYKKSRKGKLTKLILKPRYQDFINKYQLPNVKGMLPQISFITAGNWVYIYKNDNKLSINKKYSVFRLELNRNQEQTIIGTHLREVGSVKLVMDQGQFAVGRIKLTVAEYPLLPGDYLVL